MKINILNNAINCINNTKNNDAINSCINPEKISLESLNKQKKDQKNIYIKLSNNLNNKNFILCVDAQKFGTTWIDKYLSNSLQYNMGCMKEYHIWDALNIPSCNHY